MKNYQISSELHSFCRTFERDLTKPQMGRVKEMIHGIIRGKKAFLNTIANQNRGKDGKVIRRQAQQYSNMLLNLPLGMMIFRKLKAFKREIDSNTPIYIDLVDITKKYHKGMECIGQTWDGSEGEPGKGYEIIDVSIKKGNECMTLYRHMFSTAEEDYKGEVDEFEKVLNRLGEAWGEVRGTLFVDTGGDNRKKINKLLDYETGFVVRMNVNRGDRDRVLFDEEKQKTKMMALWNKPQGFTVWKDKKEKKTKVVQLQWRKVCWEYEKELIPMYLVWAHREGDPSPVVFLTTRKIENEATAEKVYHQYFGRGSEEAVFKCHKEKLGMEKVRLRSFEKVKKLMMVYVLVDQLLTKLKSEATKLGTLLNMLLKSFLKGTQRIIGKWSVIDWYDDYYKNPERETVRFRRRYPPPEAIFQASLFPNLRKNGE